MCLNRPLPQFVIAMVCLVYRAPRIYVESKVKMLELFNTGMPGAQLMKDQIIDYCHFSITEHFHSDNLLWLVSLVICRRYVLKISREKQGSTA